MHSRLVSLRRSWTDTDPAADAPRRRSKHCNRVDHLTGSRGYVRSGQVRVESGGTGGAGPGCEITAELLIAKNAGVSPTTARDVRNRM